MKVEKECVERQAELDKWAPAHARHIVGKKRWALFERLLIDSGYKNPGIVGSLIRGPRNPAGHIPTFGIGEVIEESEESCRKRQRTAGPKWRHAKPVGFEEEHLRAVQNEIMKEAGEKICSQPVSEVDARARAAYVSYAFPVLKEKYADGKWSTKVRTCVDERGKNSYSYAQESIGLRS